MTVLTDTQVVTASGGLVELGYSQITSSVGVNVAATDVISPMTVVCDGSPVLVEFYAPSAYPTAVSGGQLMIELHIDGVRQHAYWGFIQTPAATAAQRTPVALKYRVTPSAGSHTFAVKATASATGGNIEAANSTSGFAPAFLRVSKIVQATQWPAVTTGTIICTSSTRPASPFVGQQIYETDTSKSLIYNGTAWVSPQALSVPPACRLQVTSDINPYTGGAAIAFNSALYDTEGNMFSGGSPTLITIRTAGIYLVTFHAYYTGGATITSSEPRINSSASGIFNRMTIPPVGSTTGYAETSGVLTCAVADTITAAVAFSGGSAYVMKGGSSGSDRTWLTATFLGKTA